MPNEKPDSFQCGPFEVARNPDVRAFVEKLNRLREAVDQCRLQDGVGYTVSRSSGGTTLSIKTGGGGSAVLEEHPFTLKTRKKDGKDQFFVTQGMVGSNSVLVSNQETWVEFQAPANIYLEAEISDMQISKLTLMSQKPDAELKRVEIADGKQKYARISIGLYVPTQADKKDFRVVQNVRTHLAAPLICYQGYPALFLVRESLSSIEEG